MPTPVCPVLQLYEMAPEPLSEVVAPRQMLGEVATAETAGEEITVRLFALVVPAIAGADPTTLIR